MAYRKKTRTPRSRRHSSRRTRRPLRRPSASLRSFQKATLTSGAHWPLAAHSAAGPPEAPLGDYQQGYLSSCRLKATICLLGDTPARVLVTKRVSPRTPLGLEGYSLVPRSLGPSSEVRLPSGTSEAFPAYLRTIDPHLLFELEDQGLFSDPRSWQDTTFGFSNTLATN